MKIWEQEIVTALARAVRGFSLEQITRTWWSASHHGRRRARQAMRRLAEAGWLEWHDVLARPICELHKPVISWTHGHEAPPWDDVARILHRRAQASASVMSVVTASQRARNLFSNAHGGRPLKLTQVTHDLHVAEVFLRYRASGLNVSQRWVGEDNLPAHWPIRQRPDALLLENNGRPFRAVEYGGDYSPQRLENLHAGLAYLGLSYEIW